MIREKLLFDMWAEILKILKLPDSDDIKNRLSSRIIMSPLILAYMSPFMLQCL
jgi:hypothetical protein